MSFLFFALVGVLWGIGCGFCDARGILRNDRIIMQIASAIVAYGVSWLIFWGEPSGGHWFIHLIEVVVLSGVLHNYSRAFFTRR